MRWKLAQAHFGTPEMQELLSRGWEPFGIYDHVVYFRKPESFTIEMNIEVPK